MAKKKKNKQKKNKKQNKQKKKNWNGSVWWLQWKVFQGLFQQEN